MIRAGILPLVFLFAATSVLAQQSVTPDHTKTMVLQGPRSPAADCPMGMRASHGAGLSVAMNARSAVDQQTTSPAAPAQKIHLTMTNPLTHEVVGAQFVVHGFSDRWRATNLESSSPEPDLSKTVDVLLDVKGKGEASSDLSLSRFTAVTSIDLKSITYADGTTWHTPSPRVCSITPDLMMLVASTE